MIEIPFTIKIQSIENVDKDKEEVYSKIMKYVIDTHKDEINKVVMDKVYSLFYAKIERLRKKYEYIHT